MMSVPHSARRCEAGAIIFIAALNCHVARYLATTAGIQSSPRIGLHSLRLAQRRDVALGRADNQFDLCGQSLESVLFLGMVAVPIIGAAHAAQAVAEAHFSDVSIDAGPGHEAAG